MFFIYYLLLKVEYYSFCDDKFQNITCSLTISSHYIQIGHNLCIVKKLTFELFLNIFLTKYNTLLFRKGSKCHNF